MIRYADIVTESIVDGQGIRLTVFLQGCTLGCKDCHNPNLQDMDGGKPVPEQELAELILDNITPLHRGITISGGEPTLQADALYELLTILKKSKPSIDIWLYTGRLFEQISNLPMIDFVDVIVDGPFIAEQKSLSLVFKGSRNQRLIDVRQSIKAGCVVEYQLQ